LHEELLPVPKALQLEELLFDEPVKRLHVRIRVRPPWRYVGVLAPAELPHRVDEAEAASCALLPPELSPAVRLHHHLFWRDPIAPQVSEHAPNEKRGIRHAEFHAIAQEDRPALRIPNPLLVARKAQRLHLRPVGRDVPEILPVHLQARKRAPLRLHPPQVPLLLPLLALPPRQAPLLKNPPNRVLARLEPKRLLEPPRPKARHQTPRRHNPHLFQPRRLVHDPLRRTAPLHQRPGSPRLIAPQPQPHRVPARCSVPQFVGHSKRGGESLFPPELGGRFHPE